MRLESAWSQAWKFEESKCKRRRELKEKNLFDMLPDRVHGRVRLAPGSAKKRGRREEKLLPDMLNDWAHC